MAEDRIEYYDGPRCEECGIKRYFDEAGKTYCKRGHEVHRTHGQTGEDEDEFPQKFPTARKQKKLGDKTSKLYRGPRAFRLFLQVCQLVLWIQCHWLIRFPAELEILVRDLWTLRLQELSARSADVEETDQGEQAFSSLTTAAEVEDEEARRSLKSKEKKRASDTPDLAETIALCYVAVVLLRIPVGLGDFHKWIAHEDLPYIRVMKHIPMEMKQRLPPIYAMILDSAIIPQRDDLHRAVFERAMLYQGEFGVTIPSINHKLLLFRYIQRLALPLDVYLVTQRLGDIAKFDYNFPSSYGRRAVNSYAEGQLMSLLVISVKLCYPFDEVKRCARTPTEPAALTIDWQKWNEIYGKYQKEQFKSEERCGNHKFIELAEKDVFNMAGDDLDKYMDWYQNTWSGHWQGFSRAASAEILAFFPVDRLQTTQPPAAESQSKDRDFIAEKIKEMQGTLNYAPVISEDEAGSRSQKLLRPGMNYKHYRTIPDIPPIAMPFYEAAAATAGLSVQELTLVVFSTESRLEMWMAEQRRKQRNGKRKSSIVQGEPGSAVDTGHVDVEETPEDRDGG